MSYTSTVDEKYAGGYLQYSAGSLDALITFVEII